MAYYRAVGRLKAKNGKTMGYRLAHRDNSTVDMLTEDIKKYIAKNGNNSIANLKITSDGKLIDSGTSNVASRNNKKSSTLLRNKIKKAALLGLVGYAQDGVLYYFGEDRKIHCTTMQIHGINNGARKEIVEAAVKAGECNSEVHLLSGVQVIDTGAFAYADHVNKVVIPNSLLEIENAAFFYCSNLREINIPLSVTKLGSGVFSGCSSLSSLVINVEIIETELCNENTSLMNVKLTNKVVEIGTFAFHTCESLRRIILPDSIKYIGSCAFANCRQLEYINIPKNLEGIADDAFENCTSLSTRSKAALRAAGYTGEF